MKKTFTSPSRKIRKLKPPDPQAKSTKTSNPSPTSPSSDALKKSADPDTPKTWTNPHKVSKATHKDGCPNGNAKATRRKARKARAKPKAWPLLASNKPKTFSPQTPAPAPNKSPKTPPKKENDHYLHV